MLEVVVAAVDLYLVPPILLQHLDHFSALHLRLLLLS
jgi:hypothetical protein